MLFDISKFPVDPDGNRMKDDKGGDTDYRMAFTKALLTDFDGTGKPISGEEKFKRFDMYMKVKKCVGHLELQPEDVVFLTNACRDAFPVLAAGQCRDFLRNPLATATDSTVSPS